MANQGVFNRDLTQLEAVPRSLQRLQHRHVTDAQYGEILVNFAEILYPNESLHLKTTNFLRSIPMKTPQLSRVRIFQRYVAIPPRLLWRPWEEYINALNPVEVVPTEPFICNFNALNFGRIEALALSHKIVAGTPNTPPSSRSAVESSVSPATDFSITGIAFTTTDSSGNALDLRLHRCLYAGSGSVRPNLSATDYCGYQFFPHELGDRLNAPIYITSLNDDISSRFSALMFGAYQLAYNFFYRRPNVEEGIDDYYEMFKYHGDRFFPEYMPHYIGLEYPDNSSTNITGRYSLVGFHERVKQMCTPDAFTPSNRQLFDAYSRLSASLNNEQIDSTGNFTNPFPNDLSQNPTYKDETSWRNCEKYILRSGPNLNCMATYLDSDGNPQQKESFISLTRTRFAPWLMDRFTSANPWPQRGTEAQIPVNATTYDVPVNISGMEFYITNSHATTISIANGQSTGIAGEFSNGFYPFVKNSTGSTVNVAQWHNIQPQVKTVNPNSLFVTPSNFRFYMQLQHAKEKSGMTDGRYKSYMSMFFGSRLRNNQIDYPEFIGGFVQDLNVSEIEQTSESANTPLGTLAGKGVSARKGATIRFHAVEHTIILGLLHIIPDAVYLGGLNRRDHTTNPFDWVLPDFAGLSEQPIRLSELCVRSSVFGSAINTSNDLAFGYEPRYNEKRARNSYATGAFRDVMNTLGSYEYYKPWLVTRNFSYDLSLVTTLYNYVQYPQVSYNVPTLSKEFLSTRHTMDYSNFEVTNPDVMYPFMLDSYHDESIASIIPRRGIPRM